MKHVLPAVLAPLCCLPACEARQTSGTSDAPGNSGITQTAPLILELVGKRTTIQVTAGPDGPHYSIVSRSGVQLAGPMTLGEMETRNPQLHQQLRSTVATPFVWAGLNQADPAPP